MAFAAAAGSTPARALDLGSGGGLPGLVLAGLVWPEATWVLLEAAARRCGFLTDAVDRLGLGHRVVVDQRRAEEAAHDDAQRGRFDLVVARAFPGGPAVVAECGAGFLAPGGALVVSEPPAGDARWPAAGLATVGLALEAQVAAPARFVRLRRVGVLAPDVPRRTGVPRKRPRF